MKKIKNSINVSIANWLNLLPDLQRANILKIGTDSIDVIETINYCNVASLSCIGSPRDELNNLVDKFYQNEQVIEEKFDVVIFDEVLSIGPLNIIPEFLCQIKKLLNESGVLLVCCPDGWRNIMYRNVIKNALQIESKILLNYYICDPSTARPFVVIPYVKDKEWLTYDYPNINEKIFVTKTAIKEKIKKYIFKTLGIYNPFRGLIVVLENRNVAQPKYDSIGINSIDNNINYDATEIVPEIKVYITNYYLMKHYIFSYCQSNKRLTQVEKVEYKPGAPGYHNHLEQEYRNMLLFKKYIDIYRDNKIEISQPVDFNKLPDRNELSMTVVQGLSLQYLVDKGIYYNNCENVIDLLDQATDMQICFQKLTESKLEKIIYSVDEEYYLNYLELDSDAISLDDTCIQHSDLAANNIFFNAETDHWGLIDWEGLGQGYSPMLDLLSMFTSFRFTLGKKKYHDFESKYYDAIITTYFSDNWISQCVLRNLKKYCIAYAIDEKSIYKYFVLFLIFQCNKYRIYKLDDYQILYEKILRYSIDNKDKFIA